MERRLKHHAKLQDIIMSMSVTEQRLLQSYRTRFCLHFEISEAVLTQLSDIEEDRLLIEVFRDQATRSCMDVIRQNRESRAEKVTA